MTREEAIYRLKNTAWLGSHNDREATERAVDMAIEALADRSAGEWIIEDAHTEHCSVCGYTFYTSALFAVGGNDEPNYCPNCGAIMNKGGADE